MDALAKKRITNQKKKKKDSNTWSGALNSGVCLFILLLKHVLF